MSTNDTHHNRQSGRLLQWNEIEPWMKDNEFIETGYRKASYSYRKSTRTILRIHNETGNIWSHLIGALLFTVSLYAFIDRSWIGLLFSQPSHVIAISLYYLAVVNCFVLSTAFHTFANHSREVHRFGNQLDHLGVVLVIYGSAVPAIYFAFYCQTQLQMFYWSVSTAFALASAIFTLRPKFRQPSYRKVRFYMYSILGASCFLPIFHGLFAFGYQTLDERMGLSGFVGLGILNFSGAVIYAARVPERWFPRKFDYLGNSHQIMHVLVVMGALSFENGLLKALHWWSVGDRSICK